MHKLLIVDDEMPVVRSIVRNLESGDYQIDYALDGRQGLEMLEKNRYHLVICDLMMPDIDGLQFLVKSKSLDPNIIFIMITAFSSIGAGVKAVMSGAYDFLEKPFDHEHLAAVVRKGLEARQLKEENLTLKAQIEKSNQPPPMVGVSPAMKGILNAVKKLHDSSVNILIEGESGTGKELLARHIHCHSPKRHGPFLALNCAAVPSELLESELFGHEKGSFTGASRMKEGLLEAANNGTFFLDEVNNLGLDLQAKILRALQERSFLRVGGTKEINVDVRIIAATNQPLKQLAQRKLFREDLYYRLNVVSFTLPPLRERILDIPLLTEFFVSDICRSAQKSCAISPELMKALQNYSWPGNIRELRNVVERLIAFYDPADTSPALSIIAELTGSPPAAAGSDPIDFSLEKMEMNHIRKVLEITGDNKSEAAKLLKINYSTLYRKLKRYGLQSGDNEAAEAS